ncbi:DUF6093 family protein [Glutamicibacter sp. AOP5-A2-18]|uniref:DUF6093 family protein n=1 Tax=Glutamicibacter sp. AOP5-A2-18 TaxID=3457656 RepID=UPI00403419B2
MIDAQAITLRGREAAESLMLDTGLVERSLGLVTDPVTAVVSEVWETVYTGKCKLQGRQAQASTPDAGGHAFTVEQLMVHLPVSAQSLPGDRVTVLSSVMDPDLVGLKLRLTELGRGTYRTADRWNVELVTQ